MSNYSPFEDFMKILDSNIRFMKNNKTMIKIYLQKVDESKFLMLYNLFNYLAKFDELFDEKLENIYCLIDCYPNFNMDDENDSDDDY